jgi:hypothetical protein
MMQAIVRPFRDCGKPMVVSLGGLVFSLATLLGGLSVPAAAAATPSRCEPLTGLQTSDIARAQSGTGSEVTEYFAAGADRVTKCTARGAILRSDYVEAIAVPGGRSRCCLSSASRASAPVEPAF